MKEIELLRLRALLESSLLSKKNGERLIRSFYDAAKIVYKRQKRLKKPELKPKEISSAMLLADSLQTHMFRFQAIGPLAECFGTLDEAAALRYYEAKVMGSVTDLRGRTVQIEETGMRSLYKDAESGAHVQETEHYEQGRGKRLPWIRHTLEHSTAVYVNEETVGKSFRRSFLYTATVSIPVNDKPSQTSYYVVVTREFDGGALRFVTAYSMLKRNKFLNVIESCTLAP